MKRSIKRIALFLLMAGLLVPRPVRAQQTMIICYYMGGVRDAYGHSGDLWLCEVWHGTQFLGSFSQVVRQEAT